MTLMRLSIMIAIANFIAINGCRTIPSKLLPPHQQAVADLLYETPRISAASAPAGTYVGFMRLSTGDAKIPFVLELVAVQRESLQVNYQAIVRYALGAFDSQEFFAEYYSGVVYQPSSKKFMFPIEANKFFMNEVELKGGAILTGKVTEDKGINVGAFTAVYAGVHLKIDAETYIAKIYPDLKLLPKLSGTYAGSCNGKASDLNVELSRWSSRTVKPHNFLTDYKVKGYIAEQNKILCGSDQNKCIRSVFNDIKFNLANRDLIIDAAPAGRQCVVSTENIICGSCTYSSKEAKDDWQLSLKRILYRSQRPDKMEMSPRKQLTQDADLPKSLEGEYFGYLHYEQTGRNQLMRLKVKAFYDKSSSVKNSQLTVSGVTTLFFGNQNSNEFIVHRYSPRSLFHNGASQIFDGPGESFMQVLQWNKGALRGVWYSKTYGRVGSIELIRNSIPMLSKVDTLVSGLSGTYDSDNLRLNIIAQANLSEGARDFFPMYINGSVQDRANSEQKSTIKGASFDTYTGQLSFELQDRVLVVGRMMQNQIKLNWPKALQYGKQVEPDRLESLVYERSPFQGTTATREYMDVK